MKRTMHSTQIHDDALSKKAANLIKSELQFFLQTHPNSVELGTKSREHFLYGVPMHWMNDWGTPCPLFVRQAQGAHFTCADNIDYADFCLGDTGAMFGHSPEPVARALEQRARRGYTTMLPDVLAPQVGAALAEQFGMPCWQITTTATDANRFVLRWARAVTDRKKLLVFDGCYHGTVDDTMVDILDNRTVSRASLLGQNVDLGEYTVAVDFNDLAAVERELASGDYACLLTEPALTNCGMVPALPGFIAGLRELTQRYGSLLILDETHTISSGRGVWARHHDIKPDFMVIGKPIAGGLPAAAYGFSGQMAAKMQAAKDLAPAGHSGIGTTLSGNMMTMAAIYANLTEVATPAAYSHMFKLTDKLEDGLNFLLKRHGLPWCITRIGARLELQFCKSAPINAKEARASQNEKLEHAIHLFLLNRGVLLTPFHNMMLVCPATSVDDINKLLEVFGECLDQLV
jgi:glutamate-1-semialdehyde 2,1-aminomutase